MGAAVVSQSDDHRPARPLLPPPAARLAGFAALALLGALEWRRLIEAPAAGQALLWVAIATLTGLAIVACERVTPRRRSLAVAGVAMAGVAAALVASGVPLDFFRPRHWPALGDGLAGGVEALSGVRLPYAGADPWPVLVVRLGGSLLCVLAALLAFCPRERGRGFPFLALAVLLVLVATPVVSIGGTRPLLLGLALAALTFAFLWLERLPLRPGLGVAALAGIALAGALPLAGVADRGEAWFDYRAFAESLGPQDPIRFDFDHGAYGPITWPRNGSEVLRVSSEEPLYWKVANLDHFDGDGWREGDGYPALGLPEQEDVPGDFANRPSWTESITVSVRRLRTGAIPAAGTILSVDRSTRPIRGLGTPGRFVLESDLRRGDSYTLLVHAPRPSAAQLEDAEAGEGGRQADDLVLEVALSEDRYPAIPRAPGGTPAGGAQVVFNAFDDPGGPTARYPTLDREGSGAAALHHSAYARMWALAQRLRSQASSPYEYVQSVNRYLQSGFSYSEAPPPIAPGRAPLDAFLFDTKEGYCQHFSGAMALLLRMGGVPARVATGFSPGGFSKRKDAWIVRDTDAHSWVEAWFDPFGWVTFDPTPSSTPARSQIAALDEPTASQSAPRSGDDAAGGGRGSGGDQGGGQSRDLRLDLLRDAPADDAAAGGGGGTPWWAFAAGALAACALAAVAWRVWRRRRPGRRGRQGSPLDRAIAELEAALRRSGRPAPPGTTLRQLEQRLGGSPEAAAYLRALRAGRYAVAAPLPTAAQRRALRRELAAGLGFTGRVRAFLALPPWVR